MQVLPAGWPADAAVEVVPDVVADFGASTPGAVSVSDWSIERQLTGSLLPGQVRAGSGFSIASGSVSFPQTVPPLSPWDKGSQKLSPGGSCSVYATHTGEGGPAGLKLGQFIVGKASGASATGAVTVGIEENSVRLKRPFTLNWRYTTANIPGNQPYELDASWVIDQVARAGGYYQTPPPVESAFLSLPLTGGPLADRGENISSEIAGWVTAGGLTGLAPMSTVRASAVNGTPLSFYITCQVSNAGGRVTLGDAAFDFGGTTLTVSSSAVTRATVAYPAGGGLVKRVQAQVERVSGSTYRVRVRVERGQWTAFQAVAFPAQPWTAATGEVTVHTATNPTGRWIRGVQLHTTDDPGVWAEPNAVIDLAGSPMHAAFDIAGKTAWDVAQAAASATFGAVWITEDGTFTYRNRERLRGVGVPVETVEALHSLESLDWEIDAADTADRVELTYTPATVIETNGTITLWEATEVVQVNAGQTITVFADINGTTDRLAGFTPLWNEAVPAARLSRWAAASSPDGGGAQPAGTAVTISATMAGASRVKLTIKNTTSATLWLVDGNGNPCIILRSYMLISPGEQVSVSSGPLAENAVAPLTVDCGAFVQDPQVAQQMLAWVSGQTKQAQALLTQVRVKPDLRRQIGDVIRLTDGHSGLRTKALITGVSLAGSHGSYTQHLDLSIMAVNFNDVDAWGRANNITTFADLDAWGRANNITTFADVDAWGQDLGGTI